MNGNLTGKQSQHQLQAFLFSEIPFTGTYLFLRGPGIQIRRNIYVLNNSTQASLFLSWEQLYLQMLLIYLAELRLSSCHTCLEFIIPLSPFFLLPLLLRGSQREDSRREALQFCGETLIGTSFCERKKRERKCFCIILLRLRDNRWPFLFWPKVFASKKKKRMKGRMNTSFFQS